MNVPATNIQSVIPAKLVPAGHKRGAGIQSLLRPHHIIYVLLLIILTACGSNQHSSPDRGSISFKLQLSRPTTTSRPAAAASADICTDYGITDINVGVLNSSGATVATESWSCSTHQGTITGVPAGANYTVKLEGVDSNDTVAWTGEKTDISITGGSTTDAGTITMTYVGSDITPPTITATNPSDGAANVPVTILITATFNEVMAISSINTVTFTVKNGATPVNGSVTYDSNTKKAIFIPPGNLSYSTTYTATITAGVEDMAGNNMHADHSWSFTTESPPTSAPSVPTGVNATAGNGQVTITWDAVAGATSYNIYWSTTAGVIKANGTKISNVTSPYIHSGRTNGTTYYYVVTAENDNGESSESAEVSAKPGVADTTPPTGSVIINNNAAYTNSTSVTLTLTATDASGVSQMCISNENTCSSWETYTTSKSWSLTTGDGTKTVYVWFKDGVGNANTTPYTDSITLDTTASTDGTLSATAGDGQISLIWFGFSDATSGIGSYKLVYSTTSTPASCDSGAEIYSGTDTSYTHTNLTNAITYYYLVCALDNAGNVSTGTAGSATITASIVRIAAGSWHSIALKSNGTVWSWGDNYYGQLGDGTTIDRLVPVQVEGLTGVISIAVGAYHSLALKGDGTVWAWGINQDGQLGDGTTVNRFKPVQVTGLSNIIAIDGGGFHSAALKSDGTVWAWGYNNWGQLGDGTTTTRHAPVQVSNLTNVIAIATGGQHTVALKSDGTVWTWGDNTFGQLGDALIIVRTSPGQVVGLVNMIAIATGSLHTIALKYNGTVWVWGRNEFGQLGDGTLINRSAPVQLSGFTEVIAVGGGWAHTVILKSDGSVWAWGINNSGQLGDGTTTNKTIPVQITGLTSVIAIVAGEHHAMALEDDGSGWAWGANDYGQLGDGTTTTVPPYGKTTPVQVFGITATPRPKSVAGGGQHSIALKSNGTVWTWGYNMSGQLGDGTAFDKSTPIQVSGLTDVAAIAGGGQHTVVLKSDSSVWGWGNNDNGQLGDRTTTNRFTPVQAGGSTFTGVTAMAAGTHHTIALKSNGTVWGWGVNVDGAWGNSTAPVQVSGLSGVIAVAAEGSHSLVLKSDGTVWAWGDNTWGQIGDLTTISRSTPVQVYGLTGVTAIVASYMHSVALKSDGSVWTWGYNGQGQLGNGTKVSSSAPIQVSGLTGVKSIAASSDFTTALKSDGTVWVWGLNVGGTSGDIRTTPVQLSSLEKISAIKGGQLHALALKSDGTIWSWGANYYGGLGDGTTTNRTTPVQVGGL